MTWTENVTCSKCGANRWRVHRQVWTCGCGKQMTPAEIKPYHRKLALEDAKRKAAQELSSASGA